MAFIKKGHIGPIRYDKCMCYAFFYSPFQRGFRPDLGWA